MGVEDIKKVNTELPSANKIDLLNDYILALKGVHTQGKFDINELDQLFSIINVDRKFLRQQEIGNTISTYTNWTHFKAEDGYSIWKYAPTNYKYNSKNELYFDDALLENRGEADSEFATMFDTVYLYDGTYNDHTTEAGTETGTEFSLMAATGEYYYLGEASKFFGAKFEFQTRGSDYALKVEYWSGATWTQLTYNDHSFEDDTSDFESDGRMQWNDPGDWATTAVNAVTKYWIRISTTNTPVTTAKAYYTIPGDSVVALLALSSSEALDEQWAWCSYGSSIYVTIRNIGQSAYEGDYYITSTSSNTNKKNFFVYNHQYKANYEDSTYIAATGIGVQRYVTTFTNGDLSSGGVLSVNHDMGEDYVGVFIYDNNKKMIVPDEIELVDTNNLNVDLSSYTPITGTWRIMVFD